MSSVDKIFFSFDDVFEKLKDRTQLRARTLPDESPMKETIIVMDSDKAVVEDLFSEGVDDLRNKTGTFDNIKNYDGTLKYTLTETQTEENFKVARGLVEKSLLQYLLWSWYDSLGAGDYVSYEKQKYDVYLKELRTVTTQKNFVTPKYRPYY